MHVQARTQRQTSAFLGPYVGAHAQPVGDGTSGAVDQFSAAAGRRLLQNNNGNNGTDNNNSGANLGTCWQQFYSVYPARRAPAEACSAWSLNTQFFLGTFFFLFLLLGANGKPLAVWTYVILVLLPG